MKNPHSRVLRSALCMLSLTTAAATAQQADWQPLSGADTLRSFMSGLEAERQLPSGEISRAEYRADGSGTLHAWGASIPRSWSVEGDRRLCVTAQGATDCYELDHNSGDPNLYRARDPATDQAVEFRVTSDHHAVVDANQPSSNQGGAATASAAELAAELSNPNTAVASLTFKNQYRWFDGDLPDADQQSGYTLLFQPSLPFKLDSGDMVLWRPAIPLFIGQPQFGTDTDGGGFDSTTGLGDIAFDLAYAPKTDNGLLLAAGFITSLPTATNDLGSKRWTLGPELLIGKITPKYVVGLFPNHQWDVGGSGDADISVTTIQPFFTWLPGGGWNVGSGPIISYDWNAEQWTVPLQLNLGKTVIANGRPWKLSVELNYYVEKPDAFGPQWMLGINIAPVVKNGLASLFGLGN